MNLVRLRQEFLSRAAVTTGVAVLRVPDDARAQLLEESQALESGT